MRLGFNLPLLLTCCLALFSAPAAAAIFTVGSSGGGEPHPDSNSEVQEGFNPTISCSAEEGGSIFEVLLCLLDEIISIPAPPCFDLIIESQEAGSDLGEGTSGSSNDVLDIAQAGDEPCQVDPLDRSDFIVRMLPVMPPYGLEIVTLEEQEIEKITLRENDSSIQWTTLTLNKRDRRVRIGDIVERPSGRGAIYLKLNETEMKIPTAMHNSPLELTAAIYRTLADNGFVLKRGAGCTWVTFDKGSRRSVDYISFRSTDPAVVTSDIGILPPLPVEIVPATREPDGVSK